MMPPDAFTAQEVADFAEAERAALRRQQQEREVEAEQLRGTYDPRRIYSRKEVADLFAARRRGELTGLAWARLEVELMRAGAQGRIAGAIPTWGRGEEGPPK
jgi:hypothetical protein